MVSWDVTGTGEVVVSASAAPSSPPGLGGSAFHLSSAVHPPFMHPYPQFLEDLNELIEST